jgi:hypothetical protein
MSYRASGVSILTLTMTQRALTLSVRHIVLGFLLLARVDFLMAQTPSSPHSVMPEQGLVPTAEVAIRIAVAVWEPIYGKAQIEGQKPCKAELADGIWHVWGHLPPHWLGGTAEAEISQKDGRILRVSHGR